MINIDISESDLVEILALLKEHGDKRIWEALKEQLWLEIERAR